MEDAYIWLTQFRDKNGVGICFFFKICNSRFFDYLLTTKSVEKIGLSIFCGELVLLVCFSLMKIAIVNSPKDDALQVSRCVRVLTSPS